MECEIRWNSKFFLGKGAHHHRFHYFFPDVSTKSKPFSQKFYYVSLDFMVLMSMFSMKFDTKEKIWAFSLAANDCCFEVIRHEKCTKQTMYIVHVAQIWSEFSHFHSLLLPINIQTNIGKLITDISSLLCVWGGGCLFCEERKRPVKPFQSMHWRACDPDIFHSEVRVDYNLFSDTYDKKNKNKKKKRR